MHSPQRFLCSSSGIRAAKFSFQNCAPRVVRMAVGTGDSALPFSLPATAVSSGTLSLSDAQSGRQFIVLYFYPRDATPGCTVEARDFRDLRPQFTALGAEIIGVSRDDMESHTKFAQNMALDFPLVSDDGTLTEGFGVWKMRNMFGKSFMGIERSTFIIQNGQVVKEWRGVKAD